MSMRGATLVATLVLCTGSAIPYTCEEGKYAEAPLFQLEGVESLQECQRTCNDLPDCRALVYSADEKTCSVHGTGKGAVAADARSLRCAKDESAEPAKAGEQQQQQQQQVSDAFSCKGGRAFSGEELLVIEHTGLEACKDHCEKIGGCTKLTHQQDDVCTLYGREATEAAAAATATTACSKKETAAAAGATKAQEPATAAALAFECAAGRRHGGSLFTIGDTESIEECKRQCTVFSSVCRGINYGADKSCELVDGTGVPSQAGNDEVTGCRVVADAAASKEEEKKEKKKEEEAAVPSKKEKEEKKEAAVGEKKAVFSCTSEETLAGGDLVSFGDVKTMRACEDYCLSFGSACKAFVYASGDENCELKDGSATAAKTRGDGAVTCQVESAPAKARGKGKQDYACDGKAKGFVGGLLKTAPGHGADECRELCSADAACFLYMVTAEGACVLRSAQAVEVTEGAAAALQKQKEASRGTVCVKASAQREQERALGFGAIIEEEEEEARRRAALVDVMPFFECAARATFDPAAVLRTVSGVAEVAACREKCHVLARCRHAAYDAAARECTLLSGRGAVTPASEGVHEVCSKKENRDVPGYRCTRGSYSGGTLATVYGVTSVRECARACGARLGCLIAVHHPDDRRCVLKSVRAVPTQGVLERATVCVSEQVGEAREGFHCTAEGAATLTDGTLSLLSDVSLEGCRGQCERLADCAGVQYAAGSRTCELKSQEAAAGSGKEGVTACTRHRQPQRLQQSSRHAQVLGDSANPEEAAYIRLKFGFHVEELSKEVFEGLDVLPGAANTTTLWVTLFVRVPVGIDPAQYGLSAYHLLAMELNRDDNIFMLKLNPTLEYLGLQRIRPGAGGRWSLVGDAFEWRPLANGVLSLPMLFKTEMPLEPEGTRRWLARSVANELGVPASTISMDAIAGCTDDFASEGCVTSWTGATRDSIGGPTGLSLLHPTTRKVAMLLDVPANFTKQEWCRNVTQTLHCDAVPPTSYLYKSFGLFLCGVCEDEDLAPTDSMPASLSSGGRRLLQAATEVVDGRSATVLQAAIGARQGLPRACSEGWKPASYGVMSDAFNVEGGSAVVANATLNGCIEACTAATGCFAFSRDRTLRDDANGTCWLKRTVVPTAGDQYAFDSLGTYVVSCPPAAVPCTWKYMDGYDQRNLSSRMTSFRTQSATECKDLCELVSDCTGMTFDREESRCYFTHDLVEAPTAATQDEGFFSAVCYRVVPASPCDTSYCGVNPSVGCFPLRGGDHRCTCADGFGCTQNCHEPRKPHICNRTETLETLLQEAISVVLNIDESGISVVETQSLLRGTGDPHEREPLTPEESHTVTVASSKIDVITEHVISVTFSKTNVDELLEEEGNQTRVSKVADGLSTQLGGVPVELRRLCKVTDRGLVAACFDGLGESIAVPVVPTVKPTPERQYSTASAWCGGRSAAVANPKTAEALEDLVQASKGVMVETRTYWVGATCDENCNVASSWYWADAPAAQVDWATLAHGGRGEALLTDLTGKTCAVMQYDADTLRWGLNVADCGARGHYPVCVDTSTEPVDHADQCEASGSCDLRVTFATSLEHMRIVYFVSLPDGTTKKFHPSDLLPAGAKLVNRDGDLLGYVDEYGYTTVISWPPVDQPLNPALKAVMSGYTYPMEGLYALVRRHIGDWVSEANISATPSKTCHELIKQKHVLCVDAICELVEPILITRTSCAGAPPCLNSVCGGHGYAKGFVGFCSCECDIGFAGPSCKQCAAGYKNYPTCEAIGIGQPMYEVFHLYIETEKDTAAANHDLIENGLTPLIGDLVGEYELLYICPTPACPDPCTAPVNTWTGENRGQCSRSGVDWTSTARSAVALAGSRDFYPLVVKQKSIVEFLVIYSTGTPIGNSAKTLQTIQNVVGSNTGPLGLFHPYRIMSVYGPSIEPYGSVTPVAAPFNPPVAVGGAGELIDGAGTDMGIIIVIVIAVVLFCCCFLMFGIWRHRKAQERKNRERTEDLMMKYVNEDEDGEDVVTIFKGAPESMGIMWDDHTLMVGVCDESPASRYNLDRFRNRRLARVNGKKMYTLNDIREAVEGETCVTLEFEPKYSAIVVRVGSKLEDFYEQEFISLFADRIAEALNLMEFSEMDIDLQSIFERPERGELLLTMKLIGLTSDQVATIVAMCVTPGEPIRNGLPIAGAYLATAKFGEEANPPLWVCAQWLPEATECSGCYLRLPGVMEGGHPVWQHAPADHWLYSTPSGYWAIVKDKALVGNDVTTGGYVLRSAEPHRGAEPHAVTGWRSALREDQYVSVTKEEPTAHEFVVGQRVVFPVDLQLEDGSVVNKRSEALVMCEQGDLVQVCMLNEEYDVLTVSPDVVDSPDGPRVMVYEHDQWMPATIVKVKGSQIKVHFDCGLCHDLWLDKDAEADRLKLMTRAIFNVGDKVQLCASAPQHLVEEGCLALGELGIVIACGDMGQARPYLVEGPADMTWYSSADLAPFKETMLFAPDDGSSAPYGTEAELQRKDSGLTDNMVMDNLETSGSGMNRLVENSVSGSSVLQRRVSHDNSQHM